MHSDRIVDAIRTVASLETLILVNVSLTVAQLVTLAGLPSLRQIELVAVGGLSQEDSQRVERACTRDGRCRLRVLWESDLSMFSYGRGPRFA